MMTSLFSRRPALALLGLGLSLGLSAGLAGCQADIAAPTASAGPLDFTSYVAVGNSLTAGYSDGGLYNESIATSYPALLAQQFAATGKGPASFVQPSFSAARKDGSGYLKLLAAGGQLGPVAPGPANQFLGELVAYTGGVLAGSGQPQLEPYAGAQPDNLGVPGISVLSSVSALTLNMAPYGIINPFYERLLTAAEKPTKDYVTYIGQKNPTFFTCWMGSNDVLGFATAGGVVAAGNPFGGLTDTTRFGIGYRAIVQTISKNGTVKGAVANIPNVTSLPYFTTVPVATVIAGIKASTPTASLYIRTGTNTVREATSADLLTLTARSIIGTPSTTAGNPFPVGVGLGTAAGQSNPLPSEFVLDAAEITAVVNRTNDLNGIIAKTALRFKVPVADMNVFFTGIAQRSIATNAVSNTTAYVTGNLFGLDGVHPTPRGYAIVANEWVRVINAYYGANIGTVDANLYRGILFP